MRHGHVVLAGWDCLLDLVHGGSAEVVVNGESLRLAKVVAVARYNASVTLSKAIIPRVRASSEFLTNCLARGDCVYGVNTGFGGSADTRTDDTYGLQRSLLEMLQYGIVDLPSQDNRQASDSEHTLDNRFFARALPNTDPSSSTCMPEAWVRASMVVRTNSLASGNSGVRPELIYCIADLLRNNIIPVVPLRGSISASGDLSPLSYIAGAIQGNPGINVWAHEPTTGRRTILTAKAALKAASITPVELGPKEGLAIVNGTAVSAGAAGLALHDAHCLAVLSQVLTAMGVEALRGTDESFAPFIAAVRPHPGQVEAAQNISSFLKGSKLIVSHSSNDHSIMDDGSLRQDRYSIRTSSQWLGPQLEDLLLAHDQLSTEFNSTTDNPLIDPSGQGKIYHGGNFQAMAVTSAMEKTRSCLQIIGRMLFAQCTELINPALNNGLPPNLTADEPSKSFLMKGIDIAVAALQAELGFLAGSVAANVQTAEMNNQALNSLALVSARYTHTALDVLFQLSSYYLFALCQALDLRAMQARFLSALQPSFLALATESLASAVPHRDMEPLKAELWPRLLKELAQRTTLDAAHRVRDALEALTPLVLRHGDPSAPHLQRWMSAANTLTMAVYTSTRASYIAAPDATPLLGHAASRMYTYVRKELGVPFIHGDGEVVLDEGAGGGTGVGVGGEKGGDINTGEEDEGKQTIGDKVSAVYRALRDGRALGPVMECLRDVGGGEEGVGEGEVVRWEAVGGRVKGEGEDGGNGAFDGAIGLAAWVLWGRLRSVDLGRWEWGLSKNGYRKNYKNWCG
ncbi:phenylalanine aminomutase (L-beta-phenylalanine forming) [Physcia stellaris]|nr:phenylalanine aminomutase (L-beta-phenylalanine forming) [Physcia stellaris]